MESEHSLCSESVGHTRGFISKLLFNHFLWVWPEIIIKWIIRCSERLYPLAFLLGYWRLLVWLNKPKTTHNVSKDDLHMDATTFWTWEDVLTVTSMASSLDTRLTATCHLYCARLIRSGLRPLQNLTPILCRLKWALMLHKSIVDTVKRWHFGMSFTSIRSTFLRIELERER